MQISIIAGLHLTESDAYAICLASMNSLSLAIILLWNEANELTLSKVNFDHIW